MYEMDVINVWKKKEKKKRKDFLVFTVLEAYWDWRALKKFEVASYEIV
jgi:hypothetical protein